MGISGGRHERFRMILRALFLVAGLCTYLLTPDDIIWSLVKSSPHARMLEHLGFAAAAVALGLSLMLELRAGSLTSDGRIVTTGAWHRPLASLLRAIGLGSLLPLPGFILVVVGDVAVSLFSPQNQAENSGQQYKARLARHIGLFCAFVSMLVFSVLLVDRVADVLFALTAVISIVAALSSRSLARPTHD
jgi:hypothetical protein